MPVQSRPKPKDPETPEDPKKDPETATIRLWREKERPLKCQNLKNQPEAARAEKI